MESWSVGTITINWTVSRLLQALPAELRFLNPTMVSWIFERALVYGAGCCAHQRKP